MTCRGILLWEECIKSCCSDFCKQLITQIATYKLTNPQWITRTYKKLKWIIFMFFFQRSPVRIGEGKNVFNGDNIHRYCRTSILCRAILSNKSFTVTASFIVTLSFIKTPLNLLSFNESGRSISIFLKTFKNQNVTYAQSHLTLMQSSIVQNIIPLCITSLDLPCYIACEI